MKHNSSRWCGLIKFESSLSKEDRNKLVDMIAESNGRYPIIPASLREDVKFLFLMQAQRDYGF